VTQRSNPHFGLSPSPWVARHAGLIAPGMRVLDLAAGHGRHALFLAARGAKVLAVDRDAAALATFAGAPGITTRVADLEGADWPLAGERFDAIVVVHYLHRPRMPDLLSLVGDGGVLIYETFAAGNEAYGRPSNPDFLLRDGELIAWVRDRMTVVAFEQGKVSLYGTNAVIQRIAAVGAGAWPPPLDP
jgi:SAM-dependent methyltransferase